MLSDLAHTQPNNTPVILMVKNKRLIAVTLAEAATMISGQLTANQTSFEQILTQLGELQTAVSGMGGGASSVFAALNAGTQIAPLTGGVVLTAEQAAINVVVPADFTPPDNSGVDPDYLSIDLGNGSPVQVILAGVVTVPDGVPYAMVTNISYNTQPAVVVLQTTQPALGSVLVGDYWQTPLWIPANTVGTYWIAVSDENAVTAIGTTQSNTLNELLPKVIDSPQQVYLTYTGGDGTLVSYPNLQDNGDFTMTLRIPDNMRLEKVDKIYVVWNLSTYASGFKIIEVGPENFLDEVHLLTVDFTNELSGLSIAPGDNVYFWGYAYAANQTSGGPSRSFSYTLNEPQV